MDQQGPYTGFGSPVPSQSQLSTSDHSDEESTRLQDTPSATELQPRLGLGTSLQNDTANNGQRPGFTVIKRLPIPLGPLEASIHVLALACSAVIIWLCKSQVYFQDASVRYVNVYLNGFQFVATLHTAMIGASLSIITMYQVLYELTRKNGVPFVYLTYPSQLASISIFLRRRFWESLWSTPRTSRKFFLGLGILAAAFLQALVAPASAILIVPQLNIWNYESPFGNTDGFAYFNCSREYIWPTTVDSSTVDPKCRTADGIYIPEVCPHANIAAISHWAENWKKTSSPSNITTTTDANELRYIGASDRNNSTLGYSAATTPMSSSTRAFGSIWQYAQNHTVPFSRFGRPMLSLASPSFKLPIMGPLVQTQCGMPYDITDSIDDQLQVTFPSDQLKGTTGSISNTTTTKIINATHYSGYKPIVQFTNLSSAPNEAKVGVLFSLDFENPESLFPSEPHIRGTIRRGLFPCTVTAHWMPTNIMSDPTTNNVVTMDNADSEKAAADPELMSRAVPIHLNQTYLDLVNLQLPKEGSHVLEYEASIFSWYGNNTFDGNQDWKWVLSALTSLQLTDALARIHVYDASMYILCAGCSRDRDVQPNVIQDLGVLNDPTHAYNESRSVAEIKADVLAHPEWYVPVEWHVQRYGYAWSLNTSTRWLGLSVILVHAAVVVIHLVIVTIRQERFEAWDGIAQLVGLANRSDPIDDVSELGLGRVEKGWYTTNVMIRSSEIGDQAEESPRVILTDNTKCKKINHGIDYY